MKDRTFSAVQGSVHLFPIDDRLTTHSPLNEQRMGVALAALTAADPDLAVIFARYGPPPLWAREPGFPTLVHIILEQQVSLASARAAFDRLVAATAPLTPQRFLELDDVALRTIGFSRQKTSYARHLAAKLASGELNLEALAQQDDASVRSALLALKGIGPWTVDIYLLMALRRQDVWPAGDLALQVAVQEVKRLPTRPDAAAMAALGEAWRPWRAVAARLLWRHYLRDKLP
jgi:DNA-3-methyladenine glycosylase II